MRPKLFKYDIVSYLHDTLLPYELTKQIMKYPKKFQVDFQGKHLEEIAYSLYNDVDYWVVLAIYNGINDPVNVNKEYLYYIPKDDLYQLIGDYGK